LCDPAGGQISAKAISISTAGVVPMIRRYTAEGHKFRLCVSLTAPTHETRLSLMPIERGHPVDELIDAVREHAAVRRTRVTLAYVMIAGVNTRTEDAVALGRLLQGIPVRLNVIPVNDDTGRFQPPTDSEWLAFRAALQTALPETPIVRRYSGGKDKRAACGMLAATV
jgi:23S rRNA (adenine2503-C2)-methyltransferase